VQTLIAVPAAAVAVVTHRFLCAAKCLTDASNIDTIFPQTVRNNDKLIFFLFSQHLRLLVRYKNKTVRFAMFFAWHPWF
jgi:hypothetical protein